MISCTPRAPMWGASGSEARNTRMVAGAASRSALVSNSGATTIGDRAGSPGACRPTSFRSTYTSIRSETAVVLEMM